MSQEIDNLQKDNNNSEIMLQLIPGKRFFALYMSFFICSVFSFTIMITASLISIGNLLYGHPPASEISFYINQITSFQFHFSEMDNASGSKDEAMLIAVAIVGILISTVLYLIFVWAMHIFKKTVVQKETVHPLLPVKQAQIIPCKEGLSRLLYYNKLTKSKLYGLYSWERLSLYESSEYTIVLKAGSKRIELATVSGFPGQKNPYDDLKTLILNHLSEEHKQPPVKRTYYSWGKAAITAGIILILVYSLGIWFEIVSSQGKGNNNCDIGSNIHEYNIKYTTIGFSFQQYIQPYYVIDNNGGIVHVYCQLHGNIYSILHPVRTGFGFVISYNLSEDSGTRDKQGLFFEMAFCPLLIWSFLIFIIIYNGRVKVFKNLHL